MSRRHSVELPILAEETLHLSAADVFASVKSDWLRPSTALYNFLATSVQGMVSSIVAKLTFQWSRMSFNAVRERESAGSECQAKRQFPFAR